MGLLCIPIEAEDRGMGEEWEREGEMRITFMIEEGGIYDLRIE